MNYLLLDENIAFSEKDHTVTVNIETKTEDSARTFDLLVCLQNQDGFSELEKLGYAHYISKPPADQNDYLEFNDCCKWMQRVKGATAVPIRYYQPMVTREDVQASMSQKSRVKTAEKREEQRDNRRHKTGHCY